MPRFVREGAQPHLTRRETQVLELVARGYTNRRIALALGVTEHTVKFHLSHIFEKLAVSNRTEAAAYMHERQD